MIFLLKELRPELGVPLSVFGSCQALSLQIFVEKDILPETSTIKDFPPPLYQ
jgi:hypothetical protein